MSNILLYILFFTLPLIHSNFLNYFGFDFTSLVNGNFEFTKVIFFDMISSLVIISFFIEKILKKECIKIYFPKIFFSIIVISAYSTFFSTSPIISLFGNNVKGHGLLMIINIIFIFIILLNKNKSILNKLLKISFISLFLVLIIGIKEYFFPSLEYENSINFAISTFGNKQFLALYLLLFIPIIFNNFKLNIQNLLFYFLFFLVFFLTKSFITIGIFIFYVLFFLLGKKRGLLISTLFFIVGILTIFFYFPEKLHSFLSRFYIWQNTLSIIFGDIKILIFGNGFETLDLVFNSFKNPYLYIYENYGFTADRSHNIFIDIFFSAGFFGLILGLCIGFLILKETKNTLYFPIFILFFIFSLLNFSSITHYLFLLLILTIVLTDKTQKTLIIKKQKILFFIPIIFSFFGLIYFYNFYLAEINYKNNHLSKSSKYFNYPSYFIENGMYEKGLSFYIIKPEIYYKSQIINNKQNVIKNCMNLTEKYKITENYFWCGDILEQEGYKNESINFYKKGLSLLPDLWNKNSIYYNNFIINNTISGNRFFSTDYSNIKEVLNKLEINNIYVK